VSGKRGCLTRVVLLERMAAVVPAVEGVLNRSHPLLDVGEAATPDGLPGDDREGDHDQVQPGPRDRAEVQANPECL
jgi:hypothetical protein